MTVFMLITIGLECIGVDSDRVSSIWIRMDGFISIWTDVDSDADDDVDESEGIVDCDVYVYCVVSGKRESGKM